jgi:hypothetical protein
MNIWQTTIPMGKSIHKALDDLGAEPLAGSGFEDETPEEGFGSDVIEVLDILSGYS